MLDKMPETVFNKSGGQPRQIAEHMQLTNSYDSLASMILNRYVFRLWFFPFIGGLLIVMSVLLIGRALKLLDVIADSGSALGMLAELLIVVSPYFLILTVPMAFLLAAQRVVSGLQQSSELDALRASGVSYLRAFRVLFAVAVLLWLMLTYLAMELLPQGQLQFNNLLIRIYEVKGAPKFSPERFNQLDESFTLYFQGEDADGWMQGVILEDNRLGEAVYYVTRKAQIKKYADWWQIQLVDGSRFEGEGEGQRILVFEEYSVQLPIKGLGRVRTLGASDYVELMRTEELWKKMHQPRNHKATVEWHRRLTLSIAVLVFALFVVPLSISQKRSGKATAYLWGIILILAMFNTQLICYRNAVAGGWPWWGMWASTALFAVAGYWLLLKAEKDSLPAVIVDTGSYIQSLFQAMKNYFMLAR